MSTTSGTVTPESDKAPGNGCFGEQAVAINLDSQDTGFALQAADVIEGEEYARAWLQRQQTGMAQPGELAVVIAFLTGEMLFGACRLIEKALEGKRDA